VEGRRKRSPRARKVVAARATFLTTYPKTAGISPPQNMAQSLPSSFVAKKRKILQKLAVPAEQYDDLSPKGSVDEGIRDLIDEINALEGCVTTSSCAGRISVFLEGKKGATHGELDGNRMEDGERVEADSKGAGVGGKGGGGRWLFVSHDPVDVQKHAGAWTELFGMENEQTRGEEPLSLGAVRDTRFIHFKFEPMVHRLLLFVFDYRY
jgi:tRNA wybutosine-synthesizing protein 3